VFVAAEENVRLLAAVPRVAPFRERSVRTLARRATAARANTVVVPDAPITGEWPAALVLTLPGRRGALVLLARTGISEPTRSRAKLLASLVAAVVELQRARRRTRPSTGRAAGRLADARHVNGIRNALDAARRIGQALAAGRPLDHIFRLTTRELRRIAAFDVARLLTLDPAGEGTLVTLGGTRRGRVLRSLSREGSAQVGAALRGGRALILREAAATTTPLAPLLPSNAEARAVVVLPLVVERETLGALILGSRVAANFRQREVELLGPVAQILAVALQHTRVLQARLAHPAKAPRREAPTERGAARHLAIGRLAEALAHEIRNPLTVIGTTIQYLRNRRLVADEYVPLLDAAVRKAREVDESLDSLLSLSRPIELRLEPASVAALLSEVAEFIRVRASEHAVDVTVEAEAELTALLDRRFLGQALLNLALNAIDAMRGGGHLAFVARRSWESRAVVITVTDTGGGIDQDKLEVIFDPYFTTKLHGTGLGLAITRRIIEEHGGSIRVVSERGQGTAFTVTLPDLS
jgi:signal transduction histidine kinase